jgi:hypothetical protein
VSTVLLDLKDPLDLKDLLERTVLTERMARMVLQVHKDLKDPLVCIDLRINFV